MLKGSKLYSILGQKCPKCHVGERFNVKNPYKLNRIFDMVDKCEHCGQTYQLEPGFFFGAMFVNYGLTVGIGIAVFLAMRILGGEWALHGYLIGIILAIVALAPLTFRLGRSIWINFFIKYDPAKSTANSQP